MLGKARYTQKEDRSAPALYCGITSSLLLARRRLEMLAASSRHIIFWEHGHFRRPRNGAGFAVILTDFSNFSGEAAFVLFVSFQKFKVILFSSSDW